MTTPSVFLSEVGTRQRPNPTSSWFRGAAGGENAGSATGRARFATKNGQCRMLHVEKQGSGAAPRRQLTLALLSDLTRFLAVLATDGEGQGPQPLLGDFLTAVEAVAVIALLEARKGVVHLVEDRKSTRLNSSHLGISY